MEQNGNGNISGSGSGGNSSRSAWGAQTTGNNGPSTSQSPPSLDYSYLLNASVANSSSNKVPTFAEKSRASLIQQQQQQQQQQLLNGNAWTSADDFPALPGSQSMESASGSGGAGQTVNFANLLGMDASGKDKSYSKVSGSSFKSALGSSSVSRQSSMHHSGASLAEFLSMQSSVSATPNNGVTKAQSMDEAFPSLGSAFPAVSNESSEMKNMHLMNGQHRGAYHQPSHGHGHGHGHLQNHMEGSSAFTTTNTNNTSVSNNVGVGQRNAGDMGLGGLGSGLAGTGAGVEGGAGTGKKLVENTDSFGLMGLLSVIRMTDQDLNTLSLGSDLSSLGLNLNSTEPLSTSFASPWSSRHQLDYILPSCYNVQPPPPAQMKIPSFSEETLFYIFYSMPRDVMQEAAAQELFARQWRYHRELKLWFIKDPSIDLASKTTTQERGTFIFFDVSQWEKIKKEHVISLDQVLDETCSADNHPSASTQSKDAIGSGDKSKSQQQSVVAASTSMISTNTTNSPPPRTDR